MKAEPSLPDKDLKTSVHILESVAAAGSFECFANKNTTKEVFFFSTFTTHTVDCFSPLSGYFVQDAGDIILTGHGRGSWEFLLHHALVRIVM